MGSYRAARMSGFLCRLCSLYKKIVIHLYSQRAQQIGLLEKLKILPVSIKKYDKLPKTVCESCVDKLLSQYEYIQLIRKNLAIQVQHQTSHATDCPPDCQLNGIRNTNTSQNANEPIAGPSTSHTRAHVDENGEQISHPIRVEILESTENNTNS